MSSKRVHVNTPYLTYHSKGFWHPKSTHWLD
jgi:hypothetical protein